MAPNPSFERTAEKLYFLAGALRGARSTPTLDREELIHVAMPTFSVNEAIQMLGGLAGKDVRRAVFSRGAFRSGRSASMLTSVKVVIPLSAMWLALAGSPGMAATPSSSADASGELCTRAVASLREAMRSTPEALANR